jgi:hypothetical protein
MGLSIRASATPLAPALRASGQLWCSILAASRSTALRWDLRHRKYFFRRSFIQFEQLKTTNGSDIITVGHNEASGSD